jgi:cytochrome b6-f complex iron-sulfur subunit
MTLSNEMPKTLSPKTSRRDFLKLATRGLLYFSGLLGLGGLLRYLSYEPDPPPPARFEVGLATDYPLNSRTLLPAIPAVLIHNNRGFSALSLVCSHLGCTVEVKPDDYVCPCHGSRYDLSGNVTHGPASSPLSPLRVELTEDEKLVVYKD